MAEFGIDEVEAHVRPPWPKDRRRKIAIRSEKHANRPQENPSMIKSAALANPQL